MVYTRPNIAYSVGIMERPTKLHLNAIKCILRYVQGTLKYVLFYPRGTKNYLLSGYSDSDMAGNVEDRKSTMGMVFYLNESLITWVSQMQKCITLSSCKAEVMATTAAACQGVWQRNLLSQITDMEHGPVIIYINNKSATNLANNLVFHGRSKHIDICYHFIRDCVDRGEIIIKHVNTERQHGEYHFE